MDIKPDFEQLERYLEPLPMERRMSTAKAFLLLAGFVKACMDSDVSFDDMLFAMKITIKDILIAKKEELR